MEVSIKENRTAIKSDWMSNAFTPSKAFRVRHARRSSLRRTDLARELTGRRNLSYLISEVEARDGIEPSNKVLQTLPFSFWVPRHLSQRWHSDQSEAVVTRKSEGRFSSSNFMKSLPRRIHEKIAENRCL